MNRPPLFLCLFWGVFLDQAGTLEAPVRFPFSLLLFLRVFGINLVDDPSFSWFGRPNLPPFVLWRQWQMVFLAPYAQRCLVPGFGRSNNPH